ncbi:hypothetical protein [Burkholderia sp. BCC0397]|uniref:beta strand repeat-containing protein n=1 Tax=Burkholderia sp. BCC0397 TaxID=486876 RepID=UPI00158DD067|nr:hypothetical protein [Burkholderia sp. BCC0397]
MAGNNLTPITGNETLWGGAGKLTQTELDYINSSPLLVAELNDYQAAINNGTAQPIGEISGSGNRLQTVTLSPGVQQIQMGPNVIGESATSFVGDLSYELGHFENYSNDQNLYNSLVPNPNDPTAGQMSGVVGTITEAESEANNYVVQQQISKNAGATIKLNGDANSNETLQSALDNAFSTDKENGISPEQDLSKFEEVASGIAGTIPIDNTGVLFYDYYANTPGILYQQFHSDTPNASQLGLQGTQYINASNVSIDYNPSSGGLQSASIKLSDGSSENFGFTNSEISSAAYTNASGNIVSTITYTHNSNGSYSATMTDATGSVVSTQQFSSDGSEVETVTNVSTPVDVNASGLTLTTNANTIDVNGADYDTTILNGNHVINAQAGDTFQLTGVGYNVNLSATGAASSVTFEANSGGTVNGSAATVNVAGSDSVTVDGSNNGISESAGDYLVANGGGNIINATAGTQAYITGTSGNFDTVNANGDHLGGTTVNDQPTGILLSTNAQANINGSGNGVNEATGDSVGIYGGGNTINTTAGALTVVGNTNGNFDTINASNDVLGSKTANGQDTGIGLNINSQVNINGSNDGINEAAGDTAGVYGGGDVINLAANTCTVLGDTNGAFDTINGNGVERWPREFRQPDKWNGQGLSRR